MLVGRVVALSRYPVKSMQGEDLDAVVVEPRGLAGDRVWAVRTDDGGIGSGKTTRRFRRVDGLLGYRAVLADHRVPVVVAPDGTALRADDPAAAAALTAALGRPLRLATETTVAHHDESPVHVVTTASLRRLGELAGCPVDPRRIRANVVLEVPGADFAEDRWTGRELVLGDVVLALGPPMPRCVMVDPPGAPPVLRTLGREHGPTLGLQASVVRSGTVRRGTVARLCTPAPPVGTVVP